MKSYLLLALAVGYPLFVLLPPISATLTRPDMIMAAYSLIGLLFIGLGQPGKRRASRKTAGAATPAPTRRPCLAIG